MSVPVPSIDVVSIETTPITIASTSDLHDQNAPPKCSEGQNNWVQHNGASDVDRVMESDGSNDSSQYSDSCFYNQSYYGKVTYVWDDSTIIDSQATDHSPPSHALSDTPKHATPSQANIQMCSPPQSPNIENPTPPTEIGSGHTFPSYSTTSLNNIDDISRLVPSSKYLTAPPALVLADETNFNETHDRMKLATSIAHLIPHGEALSLSPISKIQSLTSSDTFSKSHNTGGAAIAIDTPMQEGNGNQGLGHVADGTNGDVVTTKCEMVSQASVYLLVSPTNAVHSDGIQMVDTSICNDEDESSWTSSHLCSSVAAQADTGKDHPYLTYSPLIHFAEQRSYGITQQPMGKQFSDSRSSYNDQELQHSHGWYNFSSNEKQDLLNDGSTSECIDAPSRLLRTLDPLTSTANGAQPQSYQYAQEDRANPHYGSHDQNSEISSMNTKLSNYGQGRNMTHNGPCSSHSAQLVNERHCSHGMAKSWGRTAPVGTYEDAESDTDSVNTASRHSCSLMLLSNESACSEPTSPIAHSLPSWKLQNSLIENRSSTRTRSSTENGSPIVDHIAIPQSGFKGVSWNSRMRAWLAFYVTETGKRKSKTFATRKLGMENARELAIAFCKEKQQQRAARKRHIPASSVISSLRSSATRHRWTPSHSVPPPTTSNTTASCDNSFTCTDGANDSICEDALIPPAKLARIHPAPDRGECDVQQSSSYSVDPQSFPTSTSCSLLSPSVSNTACASHTSNAINGKAGLSPVESISVTNYSCCDAPCGTVEAHDGAGSVDQNHVCCHADADMSSKQLPYSFTVSTCSENDATGQSSMNEDRGMGNNRVNNGVFCDAHTPCLTSQHQGSVRLVPMMGSNPSNVMFNQEGRNKDMAEIPPPVDNDSLTVQCDPVTTLAGASHFASTVAVSTQWSPSTSASCASPVSSPSQLGHSSPGPQSLSPSLRSSYRSYRTPDTYLGSQRDAGQSQSEHAQMLTDQNIATHGQYPLCHGGFPASRVNVLQNKSNGSSALVHRSLPPSGHIIDENGRFVRDSDQQQILQHGQEAVGYNAMTCTSSTGHSASTDREVQRGSPCTSGVDFVSSNGECKSTSGKMVPDNRLDMSNRFPVCVMPLADTPDSSQMMMGYGDSTSYCVDSQYEIGTNEPLSASSSPLAGKRSAAAAEHVTDGIRGNEDKACVEVQWTDSRRLNEVDVGEHSSLGIECWKLENSADCSSTADGSLSTVYGKGQPIGGNPIDISNCEWPVTAIDDKHSTIKLQHDDDGKCCFLGYRESNLSNQCSKVDTPRPDICKLRECRNRFERISDSVNFVQSNNSDVHVTNDCKPGEQYAKANDLCQSKSFGVYRGNVLGVDGNPEVRCVEDSECCLERYNQSWSDNNNPSGLCHVYSTSNDQIVNQCGTASIVSYGDSGVCGGDERNISYNQSTESYGWSAAPDASRGVCPKHSPPVIHDAYFTQDDRSRSDQCFFILRNSDQQDHARLSLVKHHTSTTNGNHSLSIDLHLAGDAQSTQTHIPLTGDVREDVASNDCRRNEIFFTNPIQGSNSYGGEVLNLISYANGFGISMDGDGWRENSAMYEGGGSHNEYSTEDLSYRVTDMSGAPEQRPLHGCFSDPEHEADFMKLDRPPIEACRRFAPRDDGYRFESSMPSVGFGNNDLGKSCYYKFRPYVNSSGYGFQGPTELDCLTLTEATRLAEVT